MQALVVYGPDGKTPIDPSTLPPDAQEELRKFALFASKSVLVNGDPSYERPPAWATPMRSVVGPLEMPLPAPGSTAEQSLMFALEPVEKKQKKQVRSVAE